MFFYGYIFVQMSNNEEKSKDIILLLNIHIMINSSF